MVEEKRNNSLIKRTIHPLKAHKIIKLTWESKWGSKRQVVGLISVKTLTPDLNPCINQDKRNGSGILHKEFC